jgi:hypothetical protein
LDFAYSYSGSLGVVLLAQNEKDFFNGILDPSIEALFNVLEIQNQQSVRSAISEFGAAVIKRAHDWSQSNLSAGFAAGIRWSRSDGRELGEVIEQKRIERLVDVLAQSSDEKISTFRVSGILLGGNLGNKSFHFVVPNGESYKGYQAPDFQSSVQLVLGDRYTATIREKKKVMYATERETVTHELLNLQPPTTDNATN